MNTPEENLELVQPESTSVIPVIEKPDQEPKVSVEEFSISGDTLTAKVKELLHQGNIRRITLKNEEGHILIEIPLTIGVVGGVVSAALFPVVAAVSVIGAMVAHLTITIERRDSTNP